MSVEIVKHRAGKKVSVRELKRTAERILKFLKQDQAVLSLALVGNREIRRLNARYRKRDEPTDVLSFPLGEEFPQRVKLLGDVVISIEQAEIQAKKRGETLGQEVEKLLIHGILHLLGYDHERSKSEAKVMRSLEKKVLRALGGRDA